MAPTWRRWSQAQPEGEARPRRPPGSLASARSSVRQRSARRAHEVATQARGGEGESSVPGPTLDGGSSSGRDCTGRAWYGSRPRRRFEQCRSCAPAGRSSGRGACPPSAQACLEPPPGRASQTLRALPLLARAVAAVPGRRTGEQTKIAVDLSLFGVRRSRGSVRERFPRGDQGA